MCDYIGLGLPCGGGLFLCNEICSVIRILLILYEHTLPKLVIILDTVVFPSLISNDNIQIINID